MGIPGHLDSLGPDSEVLARVLASTSRSLLHAGSFEVARRTGSDAGLQPDENRLQAALLRLDTEVTECSEGGHSLELKL